MKIVRNSFLMHIHTFSYVNDFHIIWQEWDRAELRIQLNMTNIRISLRMGANTVFFRISTNDSKRVLFHGRKIVDLCACH